MTEVPYIANSAEANRILQASGVLEYGWAWEIIQRIVAHLPAPGYGTELSQAFTLTLNETTFFRFVVERNDAREVGWQLISAKIDRLEDYEFVRVIDL